MIKIDLKIGDTILTGKWKNKKVVVKSIGTDEYGSPTVNGKSILKIRIPKLYESKDMKSLKMKHLVGEAWPSASQQNQATKKLQSAHPELLNLIQNWIQDGARLDITYDYSLDYFDEWARKKGKKDGWSDFNKWKKTIKTIYQSISGRTT